MEFNVCLCCFSSINLLKDLKTTEISYENNKIISCLYAYLNIFAVDNEEVILESSIVYQICEICLQDLSDSYLFFQKCRRTYQKMLHLKAKAPLESKILQPRDDLEHDDTKIEPVHSNTSNIFFGIPAYDDFETENALSEVPVEPCNKNQTILQCTKCFKIFSDHSRLTEHMEIHVNFKHRCPKCNYETGNKLDYILHLNVNHKRGYNELSDGMLQTDARFRYKCPVIECDYETNMKNKSNYVKHLIEKHKMYIDPGPTTTAEENGQIEIKSEPLDPDISQTIEIDENICVKQELENEKLQQSSDQMSANESTTEKAGRFKQIDEGSLTSTGNPTNSLDDNMRKYAKNKVNKVRKTIDDGC
jgi:hypothetical protein